MFSFLKENARKVKESSGTVRKCDHHHHTIPEAASFSMDSKKTASMSSSCSSVKALGKGINSKLTHKKLNSSLESMTSETSKLKLLTSPKLNVANLPKVPDRIGVRSSSTLTSVTEKLSSNCKLDVSFPMESITKSSASTSDHVTSIRKAISETPISSDKKSFFCSQQQAKPRTVGMDNNESGNMEKVQISTESSSASSIQLFP